MFRMRASVARTRPYRVALRTTVCGSTTRAALCWAASSHPTSCPRPLTWCSVLTGTCT
jgi:hypothetical protein